MHIHFLTNEENSAKKHHVRLNVDYYKIQNYACHTHVCSTQTCVNCNQLQALERKLKT